MATTLQKEYALIYYIQKKLGIQSNGFLNLLYTPENIKAVVEALVQNKVRGQATINVEKVVDKVLPKIRLDKLAAPTLTVGKAKLLPYDTLGFMQICMRKTIDNAIRNLKQRLFVDDITDAKDGMAAYFVSTFTINNMISPDFINLVRMDKRPDTNEIANELHKRYPNADIFRGINDMSEIAPKLEPFTTQLTKNQFTNYDLDSLFRFIDKNYPTSLDETSLTNAINAVVKDKQDGSSHMSFDELRNRHEADVKARIKETPNITEHYSTAKDSRFVGTFKYKRNGTIDGTNRENVIEISLTRENQLINKTSMDTFETFVAVINKLLEIEGVPEVTTGYYKDKRNIILTEQQYHVLFPEYFVSVGAIKEKVSTASEMGGSTMKSGDEKTSIIDSYSRDDEDDDKDDEEEDYNSPDLSVGKTKKLMFAKMMATINGHPDSVPDKLESSMGTKTMIYNLNRILITELFNTSYDNLEKLVAYLTTGKMSETWPEETANALRVLRDKYVKELNAERQEFAERDVHVKAFATILSELGRLAKMDPKSEYAKRASQQNATQNDVTLTYEGYTYALSNIYLTTIVNAMIRHAVKGEFIATVTLTSKDTIKCALDFLNNSGLLTESNKVRRVIPDTNDIKTIINGMQWASLGTIHDSLWMAPALRNCSYILKHNGWERMSNEELAANEFTPITNERKNTTSSDDINKLISLIENLQGQIRPYVLNLKAVNYIIELIQKQYHITSLNQVNPPAVNEGSLTVADESMQGFVTEDSAESFDTFSQGYYISHITDQYDELVSDACENIKKALTENHLFNEGTRSTLLSKVNNSGRPAAIIADIFGEKKQENTSNIAEDYNRIIVRNIFTIAQYIINLYNKALDDVYTNNPPIANNFRKLQYITVDELNQMAEGRAPSGKIYADKGRPCSNDFILNAYLIDILFEAMYLITVNFNLQVQKTYTAQEVLDMSDIDEMKQYINATIGVNITADTTYSGILSTIKDVDRMKLLFGVSMINAVNVIVVTHPEVQQLTIGSYNKINSNTAHMTTEKMMNGIANKKNTTFTLKNRKKEQEYKLNKFLRPCDYDDD